MSYTVARLSVMARSLNSRTKRCPVTQQPRSGSCWFARAVVDDLSFLSRNGLELNEAEAD